MPLPVCFRMKQITQKGICGEQSVSASRNESEVTFCREKRYFQSCRGMEQAGDRTWHVAPDLHRTASEIFGAPHFVLFSVLGFDS